MVNKPCLTKEEQFKDVLNNEEIQRIEDAELKEIRLRYWNLFHNAFLDETHISDKEFCQILDDLRAKEQAEILQYRQKKGL